MIPDPTRVGNMLGALSRKVRSIAAARRDAHTIRYRDLECTYDTRASTSKQWFFPRYANGSVHEPAVARLIYENLRAGDVFFDIGANLGFFTVLAAQRLAQLGPGGQVHAFEMDPELACLNARSVALNPHASPVSVVCAAVSSGAGFSSFAPHIPGNPSSNMLSANGTGPKRFRFRVTTVSLDDYVEFHEVAPHLIKMDIEGAEVFAADGMKRTLQNHRPRMILEVHPRQIESLGGSPLAVIEKIADCGYRVDAINEYRTIETASPFEPKMLEPKRPIVCWFSPSADE